MLFVAKSTDSTSSSAIASAASTASKTSTAAETATSTAAATTAASSSVVRLGTLSGEVTFLMASITFAHFPFLLLLSVPL